jgi:DNA-binding PadR family transcriptional regulator
MSIRTRNNSRNALGAKTWQEGESEETIPRLPRTEALILELLTSEAKPEGWYGMELVRASNENLKRGSVYVLLERLVERKFVSTWEEDKPPDRPGIRRRLYAITGLGERALRAQRAAAEVWGAEFSPA